MVDIFEKRSKLLKESPSSGKGEDIFQRRANITSRSFGENRAREAAIYGTSMLDRALFPLALQSEVLDSPKAQEAEFRKGIFEDIERLAEQKQTGIWDEQDEALFKELQEQIRDPSKARKYVKTTDIRPSHLARKGIEKATGYELEPETGLEKTADILGSFKPSELKDIATAVPKALDLRKQKQWKNLEIAAASNPEKETLLNFAKQHNLTPEETNLLFHSKGNAKFLESVGKKSKRFKKVVSGLKDKLGKNYEDLKAIGKEGGYLDLNETEKLTDDLGKIVSEIGETFVEGPDTKSARQMIENAIEKINNQPGTVKELINSRQGLKEGINWNNIDRGDAILAQADRAFLEAIKNKNPEVYKRLIETDYAYSKYKQFSKVIREKQPTVKYKGIALPSEAGPAIAYGLTFYFGGLKGLVAKEALQRLTTEIAINPAFRAPLKRFQKSIVNGSKKQQKSSFLAIKKIMKDQDEDLYSEIKDIEID